MRVRFEDVKLAQPYPSHHDLPSSQTTPKPHPHPPSLPFNDILRLDEAAMARLLAPDAAFEVLHEVLPVGETVFEGPVWRGGKDGYLLFSNVKSNQILKWKEGSTSVFHPPTLHLTHLPSSTSVFHPPTHPPTHPTLQKKAKGSPSSSTNPAAPTPT